jgi:hypothetical protein
MGHNARAHGPHPTVYRKERYKRYKFSEMEHKLKRWKRHLKRHPNDMQTAAKIQ